MALLTDGRFSGATRGMCVGHVGPEAAAGGAIGKLRDGDVIRIDAEQRRIDVKLPDDVLAARDVSQPRPRALTPVLTKYARLVGPAHEGAVTH